ncbi:BREX system P-loop protein BrxC [Solidesulfovibrio magneticus]|uniref:BREX system P-loop protein BrxC n=1 Tax=Solidesulfovibrio magneticus (strain ATCC 700980 / DSM 13731 / RS-1) TaxID=573370 RepID=C4XLG7_SOLM1|nr:BREX system P-loop protein BrxC [Solidesulfovibrio magneticus]BAH77106.1 hypothetical protein DMR_36150 [Solidesulfovibrio magneticus RS-1]
MQIRNLFCKDLFRPINGVVKADQRDEAIVWQELDEYVVTKELDQHFRKFFETYINAIVNKHDPNLNSRIGVWVSGFFGSGKSHFIKILSYLLNNREAHESKSKQIKKAVEFFDSKIKDPLLLADIKKITVGNTDVVLFNIDSRADSKDGRGTLLSVFWNVFNEIQGFSNVFPHVAELERHLTFQGKYDLFCNIYKEVSGENWTEQRDDYRFYRDHVVAAFAKCLEQSEKAAEDWFDKAEDDQGITIQNFAKRVKEYLDRQGKDHRIIFLVDEVGQFIGSDGQLMLNLQTITEDLGRVCQGRAWVVVTSQEDIDAILGDLKSAKANDFSKIQGRFNTRLSLSSSNTDEVIQARLLEKKPEVAEQLANLFESKGDILKSQLSFSYDSASLKTFKDKQDFIANYPFVPYHFQLVQKIFESIRKAGATGLHLSRGERSMLDAFQSAAKNISEKEIGALVPLYQFYPAIESFLDTAVKRTIDQAHENDGLKKPFDIQLLQTLFLIRYVDIIKPNVDNLVTLFIDEVDADRLTLKRNIEEALQRLEKQTLISRNGDLYFFLTNEERNVTREIKNVEISSSEEVKLLAEIIYVEILKDQKQHRYKPNRRDYPFNRLLDGHPYGAKLDQEIGIEVVTPLSDEYSSFDALRCITYSSEHYGRAVIKLKDSKELGREVRIWIQTDKYIKQKGTSANTHSFEKILEDRQRENRDRRSRIIMLMEKMVLDADFYAMGQTLSFKAATPRIAAEETLDYIVQNLYNKFCYVKTLSDDPSKEIRAVLLSNDVSQLELEKGLTEVNTDAIREVREFISLLILKNHPVLLSELVEHFGCKPYGWPEFEIVLLVARLFMAGEINLLSDGSNLEPKDAVESMLKVGKWKSVKIMKRKVPSKEQIEKARKLCQDLFGKIGPETLDDLERTIRGELGRWQKELNKYQQLALTGSYPGGKEITRGLAVIQKVLGIRDTFEFISRFNEKRNELLDTCEDIHELLDFYTNQRPTWEKLIKSLGEFGKNQAALYKDINAGPALKQLHTIAEVPAPYGMLKDVDGLVSTISAINEKLVEERRAKALLELDAKIVNVTKGLDAMRADVDFRNHVLLPLQKVKLHVAEETSIPDISYQLEEFDQAVEDALDQIERMKSSPDPENPKKPSKTTKVIKPSAIAANSYLESPEDVNAFVEALRKTLLAELTGDVRIKLQ